MGGKNRTEVWPQTEGQRNDREMVADPIYPHLSWPHLSSGFGGRGVPPSAVKNAIEYGTQARSYGDRTVYTYENVKVATESDGTVVTVIKTGH